MCKLTNEISLLNNRFPTNYHRLNEAEIKKEENVTNFIVLTLKCNWSISK